MLDVLVLVAFLLVLVGIGKWASRRVHTSLDFHLAGRRLRKLPVALSLAATEFSGSGLVGGAGLAYTVGVAGSFWNLSAVPAWLILGFTMAIAFRRLALYTVPELLGQCYGERTRILASVTQMMAGTIFLAVQILVSTLAVSALLDVPRLATAVIVTGAFVVYTFAGGLLAVVWTDVVCYFVLMAAVVLGVPLALHYVGGWEGLRQALPAESFDFGRLGVMEPGGWVALCFVSYGTDQAYLQRVFAARDPSIARFAYAYTGLNYLVFGGAVALLGMSAAALLPGLSHQDEALPALIQHIFPPGLRSFFLTAILATTMSTSSSHLSAGSSVFVKDIYERLLGRKASEARLLRLSRMATVGIAGIALGLALTAPRVVDAVVVSTLVYHAATFFPIVAGLYWKEVSPSAGFWSILAGAGGGLVSHFALYRRVGGLGELHPMFFGPLLSLTVLIWITRQQRRHTKEAS
ncbi:MAG: sodium:solute symporter [Acidobacteriota bacterium]